ncbi:UvrB/UvrC protein [Thermincola ferriacetica]|uniref:UvrB/UvrC protein n=2 Tax=Thermincola TaxID=278993 RepID=D5X9Q8_THEPJ|nr:MULTISPECIES: UvrB/UvrC motif-containing protein [Thermincola]ADG81129.1 UvrB/UvrC protein [Thermincola potens JR]KNZ68472.1 UvrB/UvrC protein [Thermincola ferriacetica]
MLCEKCQQRAATVLITKIVNGHKTETRLCEVCAQQENAFAVHLEPKMVLHNIFADLFNSAYGGLDQPKVSSAYGAKCPGCAFTDAHFAKIGKLGCDKCYHTFEEKIDPLLRRIHGTNKHTGKVPFRTGGTLKIRKGIDSLKLELQQAVKHEEYEKAAELRDKIRELEKKLHEGEK